MEKTKLYIGVETKVREFDAKLLLACAAAEAGYDVTLGMQRVLKRSLEGLPRGIFFDKRVSPDRLERYWRYKKLGFKLVSCDEEGLSPWSLYEYQKRRLFSDSTLAPLEYFFAWGEEHADFVTQNAPLSKHKVVAAGHPRLDLTRRELRGFYAQDAEVLRERYGPFILMNTNFPLANHFLGQEGAFTLIKSATTLDESLEKYYLGLRDHQDKLIVAFAEMAGRIHQHFPDIAIILRPHPSENHEFWKERLPHDHNIHVIHEGNILPWLMAAKAMIHNSCTTGIEGYLVETPVIAYRPIEEKDYETYLPNVLSAQTYTCGSLLTELEHVLRNGHAAENSGSLEREQIAARYMNGLQGPLSSDRIVEKLQAIELSRITVPMFCCQLYQKSRGVKAKLGRLRSRIRSSHAPAENRMMDYTSQKFPGVNIDEIQASMAKFHQLIGRFADVHVSQLQEHVFRFIS